MLQEVITVFLITLGLGQIISTWQGWRGASLVGPGSLAGYSLGGLLLVVGVWWLPPYGSVLGWPLLTGPLALGLLLLAGSYILPPPHPDGLFAPEHPAHGSCQRVQIPHGDYLIPGFLLTPATLNTDCRLLTADHQNTSALSADSPKTDYSPLAVCVVHGAGDTKTSYKWRLVQALLAEGLTVLTIDLPGHGDYRRRPLVVPDCLSAIPAAICFLRRQPGVKRVGLVGISLGSAMAIRSLAEISIDALAALETPIRLKYNRTLFYQEFWNACRAPVLSLLRETTIKQLRQSWYTGGYISQHKNTGEVIELLNPLEGIAHLRMPILLVHGGRDTVAPIAAGQALQQAAPSATLWQVKAASHVTLTLMTQVNRQVARWLKECMGGR